MAQIEDIDIDVEIVDVNVDVERISDECAEKLIAILYNTASKPQSVADLKVYVATLLEAGMTRQTIVENLWALANVLGADYNPRSASDADYELPLINQLYTYVFVPEEEEEDREERVEYGEERVGEVPEE